MEHNLTTGSILKNILLFSIPFLISYFLQTLYGLADLMIIGRFCGVESTTAVSIGSQVTNMVTVMVVGLATGSTVLIGRAVGGEDNDLKNRAIGCTCTLFIVLSVIFTVLLIFNVSPLVRLMSTPDEAVAGASVYLHICFAGIPFITAYNTISAIFRGMGDSKSPMYFIAVACICNILLDLVFIGGLGLGAAGAALGTTLSQTISVIVSLAAIIKKQMLKGITKADFLPNRHTVMGILNVGIPISAQDSFIQVAFILITVFANRRGLSDAAAVGIVEKLIGILFLIPSALLSTVTAISSQNFGAGKPERARKTLFDAAVIAIGCGLFFAVLFQFIAPYAIGLFTSDSEVIHFGTQYMRSYVWDCIFAGIHFTFSGYFCAMGRSGISFLHNILSILLVRIPFSYYASVHFTSTLLPMGMAAPAGSVLSIIICIIAFRYIEKKAEKS